MRALLPVLLLLAAPLALGQAHEHGAGGEAMAVALHDGPLDGRAVVGGLTHFGFALVGKEGGPTQHLDASFEVTQGGVTVFASNATHEYDGLFSFDVTFLREGPYRVVARSEGFAEGVFEGVAVKPVYESVASVVLDLQAGPASNALVAAVSVVDGTGALLPHTDALVEVRRAGDLRLVSRFHAHVHEEPIRFTLAPGAPGDYVLGVVGYRAFPDGEDPDVRAVVAQQPFTVGAAPLPALPSLPAGAPDPLSPVGASAEADGHALHGMYDPQQQVGAGNPFRLSALASGPDRMPKAHVDFALTVNGPGGVVFSSESLHEYDGVFEWLYAPTLPGLYDATLSAQLANGTLAIPYQVHVLPPAAPLGAGPNVVSVEGLDGLVAGEPREVVFSITGPSGPLEHSEMDVTLLGAHGVPLQQFKLHTHDTGTFAATLAFPEEGDWTIRVDPFPLLPQAVVIQGPAGPGAPIEFAAKVGAPQAGTAATDAEDPAARAATSGPALAAALAVVALAALAAAPRRR